MRRTKLIVAGGLVILSAWVIGVSAPGLEADPGMQERIERTVAAIVAQDPAVRERFEELRSAGADRRSLLLQLALYLERSDSTEESMGGALILERLEFSPEEKLDTVLPHMEEAKPGIRRVFEDLLGTIDRPDGGEPDFSLYENRLEGGRRPRALILYMYGVSPEAALESMSRVHGARAPRGRTHELEEILDRYETSATWAEDDRAQALSILDDLSRDPAWWVRLYSAEVANRHAALGAAEISARLKHDPDPLVRAALGN